MIPLWFHRYGLPRGWICGANKGRSWGSCNRRLPTFQSCISELWHRPVGLFDFSFGPLFLWDPLVDECNLHWFLMQLCCYLCAKCDDLALYLHCVVIDPVQLLTVDECVCLYHSFMVFYEHVWESTTSHSISRRQTKVFTPLIIVGRRKGKKHAWWGGKVVTRESLSYRQRQYSRWHRGTVPFPSRSNLAIYLVFRGDEGLIRLGGLWIKNLDSACVLLSAPPSGRATMRIIWPKTKRKSIIPKY